MLVPILDEQHRYTHTAFTDEIRRVLRSVIGLQQRARQTHSILYVPDDDLWIRPQEVDSNVQRSLKMTKCTASFSCSCEGVTRAAVTYPRQFLFPEKQTLFLATNLTRVTRPQAVSPHSFRQMGAGRPSPGRHHTRPTLLRERADRARRSRGPRPARRVGGYGVFRSVSSLPGRSGRAY